MVYKSNRVVPGNMTVYCNSTAKKIKNNRIINLIKWTKFALAFPLTYFVLPVSCCVRNPGAKEMFDYNQDTNMVVENVVTGCASAVSCVACFHCCMGCCGKYNPKEIWV